MCYFLLIHQFDSTEAKLSDIAKGISSTVRERRNCDFPDEHIFSGEFNCIGNLPDQVLYKARLRGLSSNDCDNLVDGLVNWAQPSSTTSASIVVGGNRLFVAPNCEVEVNTFSDPLECTNPTTPTENVGSLNSQTTVIGAGAGAAVGAILIVILIVVVIVSTAVALRRRKKHAL